MSQPPRDETPQSSQTPSRPDPEPSRAPYEPPTLTEYGDIATLTQTGGLTKKDTGTKMQRIG